MKNGVRSADDAFMLIVRGRYSLNTALFCDGDVIKNQRLVIYRQVA